jgi:hypothetical protein
VMDLSQYRLETLHKDGEFILYRGLRRTQAEKSPPSILALSPVMERPGRYLAHTGGHSQLAVRGRRAGPVGIA